MTIDKQKGIHLYVNIKNLDNLVLEDAKDGKLNHVIHQMNTLFTSISFFLYIRLKNFISSIFFRITIFF